MNIIDPRTLFVSNVNQIIIFYIEQCHIFFFVKTKLNECRRLLEQHQTKTLPPGITDKDLWAAQKIVQVRFI
jgi:hypothetical protein